MWLTSQVMGSRGKKEGTAPPSTSAADSVSAGGGGWRHLIHLLVCSFSGQLSSLLSACCTLTFPNPLVPADTGCYFARCRLSQRETRVHAETLLFPYFCSPHLKYEYICLLFCMEKKKKKRNTNYFLSWKSEETQAFETFSWCVGKN